MSLAKTPAPPYYAVVFTSRRTEGDRGYHATAERMVELAKGQPGFLGMDSVRGEDGVGITVAYFSDEAAIAKWKQHPEHLQAQRAGQTTWYDDYEVRVAKVERAYGKLPLPAAAGRGSG